jgi:hypothetical protein
MLKIRTKTLLKIFFSLDWSLSPCLPSLDAPKLFVTGSFRKGSPEEVGNFM